MVQTRDDLGRSGEIEDNRDVWGTTRGNFRQSEIIWDDYRMIGDARERLLEIGDNWGRLG